MLEQIRRAAAEKDAFDFRGEEAALYRVNVSGENYWVKKWYRSNQKPMSMPFKEMGSTLSPFWHRLVEQKQRIINELFPEESAKIVGSYDERFSEEADLMDFDITPGRPVTITLEVPSDPVVMEARRTIMESAYTILLQYRDEAMSRGGGTSAKDPFWSSWRKSFDEYMIRLLGREVGFGGIMYDIAEVRQRIERIKAINPENVMIDFLEAGILPAHPESNFIPGLSGASSRVPNGTFLSFSIYDAEKLKLTAEEKFSGQPEKIAETCQQLEKHENLKILDHVFDQILLVYIDKSQGTSNPKSLGRIRIVLEKLYVLFSGKVVDLEFVKKISRLLSGAIKESKSHANMASLIDKKILPVLDRLFN